MFCDAILFTLYKVMHTELMSATLTYIAVAFAEHYLGSVLCIDLFFLPEIGLVTERSSN